MNYEQNLQNLLEVTSRYSRRSGGIGDISWSCVAAALTAPDLLNALHHPACAVVSVWQKLKCWAGVWSFEFCTDTQRFSRCVSVPLGLSQHLQVSPGMSQYLSVPLRILSISQHLSVSLSISRCVSVSTSRHLSLSASRYVPVSLSTSQYLSISLSISLYLSRSLNISHYLNISQCL